MRPSPLPLLFILMMAATTAYAQEPSAQPLAAVTSAESLVDSLEQRLAQSEQLRSEQEAKTAAQMQRLRQENQRLRLQLKESQASVQPGLLSGEQTWFALGAALSVVSVLVGALLRGNRRTRREWIN